jgi:thiol:disulfide interchange protein
MARVAAAAEQPAVSTEEAESEPATRVTKVKTPWYKKNSELWLELQNVDDLIAAVETKSGGKYTAVDFYSAWCSSCKGAYPAICRIAALEEMKENFVFAKANIEDPTLMDFIKRSQIKGIPHWVVFGPDGKKVADFSGAFKRTEAAKTNLKTIIDTKAESYTRDTESGLIMPVADFKAL